MYIKQTISSPFKIAVAPSSLSTHLLTHPTAQAGAHIAIPKLNFRWAVKRFNKMSAYIWKYDPHTPSHLGIWDFHFDFFFLVVSCEAKRKSFILHSIHAGVVHPHPRGAAARVGLVERKASEWVWWKWNGSTPGPTRRRDGNGGENKDGEKIT